MISFLDFDSRIAELVRRGYTEAEAAHMVAAIGDVIEMDETGKQVARDPETGREIARIDPL